MSTSDEDESGYKRPPKAHQFKPGQSGNPRGRPRGTRNLSTDLVDLLSRRVSIRENGKERRISCQEAILLSLYNKALHGDVRAATSIINMLMRVAPSKSATSEPNNISAADYLIIEDFLRRQALSSADDS